jgi:hypothetical protein
MLTASRLAWPVLVVAALVTDVTMAQDSELYSGAAAALSGTAPKEHEDPETELRREQCLSLERDIRNVEQTNALLRQKEQLLETGVTPAPVSTAAVSPMSAIEAVCHSPSADLLANLTDQDNADRKLNALLVRKVAMLEKQRKTAGTAPRK